MAEAPAWMIALPVIGFSFLQEAIEIFGHGHPFESNDVVIDVLGASLGVMLAQVAKWMLSMK